MSVTSTNSNSPFSNTSATGSNVLICQFSRTRPTRVSSIAQTLIIIIKPSISAADGTNQQARTKLQWVSSKTKAERRRQLAGGLFEFQRRRL